MITTENRTLLIQILRKLNTSQQELDNGGLPEGLTFPLKLLRDVRDLEAGPPSKFREGEAFGKFFCFSWQNAGNIQRVNFH